MDWTTIETLAVVARNWRDNAKFWQSLGSNYRNDVRRCQRHARKVERKLRDYANTLL